MIGIFFCWGVKYGLAENNQAVDNRDFGVSIGHNDTDNIVRNNLHPGKRESRVLFRDEAEARTSGSSQTQLRIIRILNSGPADGVAIDIQGRRGAVTIVKNEIRELAPIFFFFCFLATDARGHPHRQTRRPVTLADNRIDGFSVAIADQRKA